METDEKGQIHQQGCGWAIAIAVIFAAVIGGAVYMTARHAEKKAKPARGSVTWTDATTGAAYSILPKTSRATVRIPVSPQTKMTISDDRGGPPWVWFTGSANLGAPERGATITIEIEPWNERTPSPGNPEDQRMQTLPNTGPKQ